MDIPALAFWKIRISFKNPLFECLSSDIGEHLKKRRLRLGLLQKEVAAIIEVSEDTITYWENGRAVPMIHHYPNIISFLGYNQFNIALESLAGQINAYRILKGLSLKKFGKLIGVDGSTISSWEGAASIPRKSTQNKLRKIIRKA
jgi:transcriptional regulator with XRE-family HTH domain